MALRQQQPKNWTFLTNHGHVLMAISRDPEMRIRDIADEVGITERAAHAIIQDLVDEGYLSVIKEGRRNIYEVHPDVPFRHPTLRDHDIGELMRLLGKRKR